MFAEGAERNRALGVWGATGNSGIVVGVLLGRVLTQTLGWRAVFFVNVPCPSPSPSSHRVPAADPPVPRGRGPGSAHVRYGANRSVTTLK